MLQLTILSLTYVPNVRQQNRRPLQHEISPRQHIGESSKRRSSSGINSWQPYKQDTKTARTWMTRNTTEQCGSSPRTFHSECYRMHWRNDYAQPAKLSRLRIISVPGIKTLKQSNSVTSGTRTSFRQYLRVGEAG